jgi:ribosomal subunit interface protein
MRIEIVSKNININDEHKEYLEGKISNLEKYLDATDEDSAHARVEVKLNGDKDYHEKVEVHVQISCNGISANTNILAGEVNEGADLAYDKLKAQLSKQKDKLKNGVHNKHASMNLDPDEEGAADLFDVDPSEAQ